MVCVSVPLLEVAVADCNAAEDGASVVDATLVGAPSEADPVVWAMALDAMTVSAKIIDGSMVKWFSLSQVNG